jgi:hypothetical protein
MGDFCSVKMRLGPLYTSASTEPLLPTPDGDELGAVRGMIMDWEYQSDRKNQPQCQRGLTWDRTRTTAVGGRPHGRSEWMPVV